ncbi:MAG: phosphoribosyl-AMP cyclohydrolase [Candidatus Methanoliparum thermophilum]|uniref:Phosphoribosyl-AMP cyclohydrolase n=1 Tax=Methanoliparum thermophilum TaxID=2491083 RepID=A0A520KS58_METT2|nr:phosphoribosyl-AMP cyclohydrolase [Candidatus Methanoliparum sp. LAM-1]RZN64433.1 MAG: phosphoribosyl-AMP cyclohydrolase [Candidatus Methanoliparum thermophilum]BDC35980.1 phosphoribosyl-AMP cyclohydrolase [Candidatus Methanoliparum sp. LAM-1]
MTKLDNAGNFLIDFSKHLDGLIPAIVQDADTKEVLMMAYMNEEALRNTITTKKAYYWSRSRNKLWLKGEESGNFQTVIDIRIDCDEDTILLIVKQKGCACHMGYKSCFFRDINGKIVEERLSDPDTIYHKKSQK